MYRIIPNKPPAALINLSDSMGQCNDHVVITFVVSNSTYTRVTTSSPFYVGHEETRKVVLYPYRGTALVFYNLFFCDK